MNRLWELCASDIAGLVRKREVSAVEVAKDGIDHVATVNPAINAIVDFQPERVLAGAARVDAILARGDDAGPMAGVLVTIKDAVEQEGVAFTFGLRSRRDAIQPENAPLVDNFLRAGAVVLGTTNVPAFCYRWFTENRLFGKTRNPRNPALTPGGSSGGASAAVAAGMGAVGHGGDIAGSIRYPAYACGVHGLRPSLGRVPAWNGALYGKSIGSQLMATQGPIARSVADLRLALQAMAQEDMRDPWWTPVPFDGPPLPKRIGVCVRPGGLQTDPVIVAELQRAAAKLSALGWDVEELDDVPELQDAARLHVKLWMGDGYEQLLRDAEAEGDPGAIAALRGQSEAVAQTDGLTMPDVLRKRSMLVSIWQQFLAQYTAILIPVSGKLPFADDQDLAGEEAYRGVWAAQLPMIGLPFLGLPGLSLCTGAADNIPVGIQIVSNRFREDACLTIAQALETGGHLPSVATP